jgi:hypothetical protein
MPEYAKKFNGKMALDNNPHRISDTDYSMAWNITRDAQGEGQDKVVSNLVANRQVYFTLPDGVNKVIGNKEDLVRNRIYFFVWNSNNYHSILYYDKVADAVRRVLFSKTDCYNNDDVLRFNPSYKINHVDIIYREEGDLILFVDGQDGNVFCLDLTFILSFTDSSIKREHIQLAKKTSQIAPFVFFEDDITVTVNNLRKNLYKFKVRYFNNDLTKSITSSQSVMALPVTQNIDKDDASKNAKISVAVLTGDKNVYKVEVLAAYNTGVGNVFSDYFIINSIDKKVLGLNNNDVYVFPFYNNEAYNNIDVKESTQEQDYVPQAAFTQANPNGNTITLANIKEGYDLLTDFGTGGNTSTIANYGSISIKKTNEFGVIKCYQGGNSGYDAQINNGNITIVVFGNFKAGSTVLIYTSTGSITYAVITDQNAAQVRAGIQAQAVSAGFTIVSSSTYNGQILVIRKFESLLYNYYIDNNINSLNGTNYKGVMPVYDWWSRYSFGLVYFDDKDRTNGVVYPRVSTIQTDGYKVVDGYEQMQNVLATIWHKPPIWAAYYHIVRTKNMAKSWFVQWISDITLKEIGSSAVDNSYAYIGINPLNAFIAENKNSNFLGYGFVVKDRIRLIKNNQNKPILVPYTTNFASTVFGIGMTQEQANGLYLSVGDIITIGGTTSNNITTTITSLAYGSGTYVVGSSVTLTSEIASSFSILTTNGIKYANKDFEILELVTNPTINGVDYVGQYVKIILPTTNNSFDFGTDNFNNYFFELYRPAVPTQGELNLFYEFGERYLIANAGTTLALHQGEFSSQTVDVDGNITQAALVSLFEGDNYGRYRDINTQPKIKWVMPASETYDFIFFSFGDPDNVNNIIPVLNYSSVYNPVGYTPKNSIYEKNVSTFASTSNTIIDITDTTISRVFNITASGLITYGLDYPAGAFDIDIYAVLPTPSNTSVHVNLFHRAFATNPVIANQKESFSTSITLTVPIGYNRIIIKSSASIASSPMPITLNSLVLTLSNSDTSLKQFCIDPNVSDYYASAVNSNGREWIHDVNAKQQVLGTTIRFSNEFQQNTNINRINRFYAENFDDYDKSNGTIQKLFIEGRRLYVHQEFDTGVVPVLQQIIKDVTGNPLQADSDKLLNKITYPYQGKLGLGNVPESWTYHNYAQYGIDNNKGVAWRLSQDGKNEISVIYDCDSFFKEVTKQYNKTYNTGYPQAGQPYLGNPTIYAGFDRYTNKVIWAFEGIKRYDIDGNLIFTQEPKTIIFNETRDESEGFECFANIYPENIAQLGTLIAAFKDGQIWTHDAAGYNTFFGTSYDSSITVVFNNVDYEKKTFQAISEIANEVWDCPEISTQTKSYGNTNQQSSLIKEDFTELEGTFEACFLRDANSIGGLLGGDGLYGHYIIIKLRNRNVANFVFLNMVAIKTLNSPLTTK